VRSASSLYWGYCLDSVSPSPPPATEARRELLVEEANSIGTTARRAELLPQPHASNVVRFLRSMCHCASRRIVRRNFRSNLQRCANAPPISMTVCGLKRSPLPQSGRHRSRPVFIFQP